MSHRQPLRTFAALGLIVGGLVFSACPPREVAIEITPVGAGTMIGTCGSGLAAIDQAHRLCTDAVDDCRALASDCLRQGCDDLEVICQQIAMTAIESQQCDDLAVLCDEAAACGVPRSECEDLVTGCNDVLKALDTVCIDTSLHRPEFNKGPAPIAVRVVLVTGVDGEVKAASGCGRGVIACDGQLTSNCIAFRLRGNDVLGGSDTVDR